MAKTIPGTTEVDVRENDLVWTVIHTIDNRLDDIAGIRPLRLVGRALTAIAPANVVRNVTGIPKPSEVVEGITDELDRKLRNIKLRR